MNTAFKERPIDPPDFDPRGFEDLSAEEQIDCIAWLLRAHPTLIYRVESELKSRGVDPFDFRNE